MIKLEHKETAPLFGGKSVMRSWKPGVIQKYLSLGHDLPESKRLAKAEGALVETNTRDNLILTSGYALFAACIIDADDGIDYLEIGTDDTTPTISDTECGAAVARKQFTTRTRSSGAEITCSVYFPREDCTYAIEEVCIYGGAAATATIATGTAAIHYLQSYDNGAGTYDLTFDYVLSLAAA